MSKSVISSALIYDSGADTELHLRGRLESRCRKDTLLHVVVRLKSGATHIGRVCYFDSSRLTLAQENRNGQLCDLMYTDIARIVAASKQA
jgi:hypothetical protein